MKPCKEKPTDGKLCPNRVDDGQEYCFYHLASQDAKAKKMLSSIALKAVVFGIINVVPKVNTKAVAKGVASFLSNKK